MQAVEHFRIMLWHLQHRRGMYVGEGYKPLTSFITGYLLALRDAYSIDLFNEFQNWIYAKEKRRFATVWHSYILIYKAKEDEQKATEILFEWLSEFVDSPQWTQSDSASNSSKL